MSKQVYVILWATVYWDESTSDLFFTVLEQLKVKYVYSSPLIKALF